MFLYSNFSVIIRYDRYHCIKLVCFGAINLAKNYWQLIIFHILGTKWIFLEKKSRTKLMNSSISLYNNNNKSRGWLLSFGVHFDIASLTLTHFWKLLHYRVKIEHYCKEIGTREYLERVAHKCYHNPFPTETGTPAKNMSLLDAVGGEEPVAIHCCLDFTTSLSCAAQEISTSGLITPSFLSSASSLSATSLHSRHTLSGADNKEGGKYKKIQRGYCSGVLPNGKRCSKISLWFWTVCSNA